LQSFIFILEDRGNSNLLSFCRWFFLCAIKKVFGKGISVDKKVIDIYVLPIGEVIMVATMFLHKIYSKEGKVVLVK